MGKKEGGATPAVRALEAAGVRFQLRRYEHDPRTQLGFGLEASQALQVSPERVFKTLVVMIGRAFAVAVLPVGSRLDLKAMARALGVKKVEMADPAAAERATGYVVGGISPLGQRTAHPTAIDSSALEHASILVSGGRRGLDVELAPATLAELTDAVVAQLAV